MPFGPRPVDPGLLEADEAGRWGTERSFGGRFVPETLMAALLELEVAYEELRRDPSFWAEFRELLATYVGRPTPVYRADRLAAELERRSGREPGGMRLYLKREDLDHTGAHKINNALGQALLTMRLGKRRVIAETGAGQHGVATATACALLDLECVVYMGAEDIRRQAPNVLRMRALGAEVREVTVGHVHAQGRRQRDHARLGHQRARPATTCSARRSVRTRSPAIVRDLQRVIGDESAEQMRAVEGRLPDIAIACVGGGSNAIGLLARFIGETDTRLIGVEAAGEGLDGRHAAALSAWHAGVLHGSRSYLLQDDDGQITEAFSISAGLDYPGIGPQLSALYEAGRLEILSATDEEALEGVRLLTRTEGILPALEPAHAIHALLDLLRGRGHRAGCRRRHHPAGPLGSRRQGHRRDRGPADGGHGQGGRAVSEGHGRARRITRPSARPTTTGVPRSSRIAMAGYPDAATSLEIAVALDRRRCRRARDRPALFGPAGRRRHAPACLVGGAGQRRHAR